MIETGDKSFWQAIVDAGYAVPAGYSLGDLTPALLGNLGSPDPVLRDDLAYMILATWVSRGEYGSGELRAMAADLLGNLRQGIGEAGTDTVFLRAFSALILGELTQRHQDTGVS